MGALVTKKSCLQCHGMQGYKEGDIRGGIRVSIPTNFYKEKLSHLEKMDKILKGIVVVVTLIIMIIHFRLSTIIFSQREKLKRMNESLEIKVKRRTNELEELNQNLEKLIKEAVEKNKEQEEIMIAQSVETAHCHNIHGSEQYEAGCGL